MSDLFPTTRYDWLAAQFDRGERGRDSLRTHIIKTYSAPLEAYYRSTSWFKSLGRFEEWRPDTLVHAFMADRIMRPDYLERWRQSGRPLRKWLIRGLHFMLREQYREHLRHRPRPDNGVRVARLREPEPGVEADRLVLRGMVRLAKAEAVAVLRGEGRGGHARVFAYIERNECSTQAAAERFGVSKGKIQGQLRVARSRFEICFLRLLHRDGVAPSRVDDEVRVILAILGDGG